MKKIILIISLIAIANAGLIDIFHIFQKRSRINREEFDKVRTEYWKQRAEEIKRGGEE